MAWRSFRLTAVVALAIGLGVSALEGCGGDNQVSIGAGDAAAEAGSGGSGGSGSGGGSSSGGATAQSLACGTKTCTGETLYGRTFPACCVAGGCGLDLSVAPLGMASDAGTTSAPRCIQRDAPGKVDSSCPSSKFQGFVMSGCCRPDNTCGIDVTLLPLGCASPAELAPGGADGGALQTTACNYASAGSGSTDAGPG